MPIEAVTKGVGDKVLCIPAIDLAGGQVVRLYKGNFDQETPYGDPFAIAENMAQAGARRIHIVDLDAAKTGDDRNYPLVMKIGKLLHESGIEIEFGGGIRSKERVKLLCDAGIDYFILGTILITDFDLAAEIIDDYPDRVIVGLDYQKRLATKEEISAAAEEQSCIIREVSIKGWQDNTSIEVKDVLSKLEKVRLEAVLLTDISKDGTLAGPDTDGYQEILEATDHRVIASGGVGSLEDLVNLARIRLGNKSLHGKSLHGAVVGKALLSGKIRLEEAISVCGA